MTPEIFKTFCEEWKKKGAMDFTRKSHYEEMNPLFEPHAEVVELTEKDFHNLGTENGVTTWYPKKETADTIRDAVGISFRSVRVATRKESETCYVGTAQTQYRGPDGEIVEGPPTDYEYDAKVRARKEILESIVKYGAKSKYKDPVTGDAHQELCVVRHQQVGRRRANTGSRVAAIIATVGMPTGFKDLFKTSKTVYLLFSRIIYNAKNKMVMDRALDSLFPAVKQLTGESIESIEESGAIDPIVDDEPIQGDFEVSGPNDEPFDDLGAGEAFDNAVSPSPQINVKEGVFNSLRDLRNKYPTELAKGLPLIDKELAKGFEQASEETLVNLFNRSKATLESMGVRL